MISNKFDLNWSTTFSYNAMTILVSQRESKTLILERVILSLKFEKAGKLITVEIFGWSPTFGRKSFNCHIQLKF